MFNLFRYHYVKYMLLGIGLMLCIILCGRIVYTQLWQTILFGEAYSSEEQASIHLQDTKPSDVFLYYVQAPVSSEVTNIQGVEGGMALSEGPALIRFEATDTFITGIIEGDYTNYDPYSPVSCTTFYNIFINDELMQNFAGQFEWWRPEQVKSPACYLSQGSQADDIKYLLVDSNRRMAYFYRTATCMMCPGLTE